MLKKLKELINNCYIKKGDIKLIILAVIALILLFFNGTSVFASTSPTYNWSDTKYNMNITDLYNLMTDKGYNVNGEDFSTYSYIKDTKNIGKGTTVNFSYSTLTNLLASTNNTALFTKIKYNDINMFTAVFLDQAPETRRHFQMSNHNTLGNFYNLYANYIYIFCFDVENKTVYCGYCIEINNPYFAQNISLGTSKWFYNDTSDTTLDYFKSIAYQQNLLFDSFYLVNGPFYNYRSASYIDGNTLINKKISNKITNATSSGYSGDISYSTDFEKWLTNNLSESFLTGEYSYYLEHYLYTVDGINLSVAGTQKICDITFTSNSIFAPSNEEIITTIKSIENYEDYIYSITLNKKDNENEFLLSSDFIIINANPMVLIPHFIFKYDYEFYHIETSGDSSGDIITPPSGDEENNVGGGILDALINLPKNLLDGLIGLFVPDADFFFNENLDEKGEPLGYFNQLNFWFSDRLGFLYYPFDFMIDFFNRYLDVDSFKPVFVWNDIYIPFFDSEPILKAGSFDLKADFIDLDNDISDIYNTYLVIMDGTIVILLIALLLKKYEEVTRN